MRLLGIRVEPKKTTFVVLGKKDDKYEIINVEPIKVPAALDFPEQLKYIRTCVLDIIREFDVSKSGIRVAEGNTQNLDMKRLHIEGVIQEAYSSSSVDNYFTGRKKSISSRLNLSMKDLDSFLAGDRILPLFKNSEILKNKTEREAAVVAAGADI